MKLATSFSTKPVNLLALLNGSREKFLEQFDRELKTVGELGVNKIRREFRSGGTTATRTAVRSARLWNAYSSDVKRDGRSATLKIGAIQPTDGGKVPIEARIHEGYDADGNRVSQFVIRPVNKPYLVFPIREGGGLSKANIKAWVRTKGPIILKPRPSLPAIATWARGEIKERGLLTFRRVLVGKEAA